ncbi:hypothetical protein [Tenuifilum osseticum]
MHWVIESTNLFIKHKYNPDLYLPSNFDYKTGVQTKSPCDSAKPEP